MQIFGGIETGELYQKYSREREVSGKSPLSYVLISGGPDSETVLRTINRENIIKGCGEVRGLFVNFGQPYLQQELEAARAIILNQELELEIIHINQLSQVFKEYGELGYPIFRELLPATIGIASLYALFHGAEALYHGQILEDEKDIPGTFSFFETFQKAINFLPGAEKFRIVIPFGRESKEDVFVYAIETGVPLEITISCLKEGGHCGKCRSCIRRKQAFKGAKIEDPTYYQNLPD